ncbi:uncharacterized protein LOC144921488 [Branchiostoma floridae x Branchiostoma belcheri]
MDRSRKQKSGKPPKMARSRKQKSEKSPTRKGMNERERQANVSISTESEDNLWAQLKKPSSLNELDWSGSQLKSLPWNLTPLAAIETLNLSNNELAKLPPSMSGLEQLKVLILSDNAFEGIPELVKSLNSLQCLIIKRNRMNNSQGDLKMNVPKTLKTLDMESNCSLKVVPEGLEHLENLEELNISYCGIEAVSDAVGKLTSIRRIHLAGNKLRALPEEIGNLLYLETLDLEGNRRLSDLPVSLYRLRENLRDKQTGTNKGLILDNCPALALPESEIAQGNVVSVLAELVSRDVIKLAEVNIVTDVVEDTIIEGLMENTITSAEESVWDDLMLDVTDVVISDKECSEDIFHSMLEKVLLGLAKEISKEAMDEEEAMALITDELVEEMTRTMLEEEATSSAEADSMAWEVMRDMLEEAKAMLTIEVASDTVQVDDVAWKVMEEMLEEVETMLTTEVATEALQADRTALEVMRDMLEEATAVLTIEVASDAVLMDDVAWKVMEEMLEEVMTRVTREVVTEYFASKESEERRLVVGVMDDILDDISKEFAICVDAELRLGQTVPDEYDTQISFPISSDADGMQYLDLPAGCRLSVPPGATDEDISVISAVLNPHGYDQTVGLEDDELLVSDIIEMRPAGMKFSKPVKLKIPHSLPKFFCEKEFIVKTTEDLGRSWMNLDTVSQQEEGQWFVTVEVSHFSEFAAVARPLEHCQTVEEGQASTLRSSEQTKVEMCLPKDSVPQNCEINFKVLPVDADTLTCAAAGEDGISGVASMSHIVKFSKNLILSSPATIILPLSPGDQNTRLRVLSCDERGHWEDITSSVDDIVLQGSKMVVRSQLKHGFTVLRCGEIEDATRIVNMVIKNIRARQVRIIIFKKWKEPPEDGVMTARIECVLNEMVEDRKVCAKNEGFECQPGTPTPPIVMTEGEEFCVIFEGSIRPVENDHGVDYIFYCERPRVLEFDVKLVDKGKGATTKVELYPGRLERLYPGARRRKIHGQPSTMPPPTSTETPPPPRPTPLMTTEITPPTAEPREQVEVDEPGEPDTDVTPAADPGADSDLPVNGVPLDESGFSRALSELCHAAEQARYARGDDRRRWLESYRQAAALVEEDLTSDDM